MLLAPPWPLASNPLIAHCGPLVALLNGACTLSSAITVGKQAVKYGKLQSRHKHISAFRKVCSIFLLFHRLLSFLCHLFFLPYPIQHAGTQWHWNVYTVVQYFSCHLPHYSVFIPCCTLLLCFISQQWSLFTFFYFQVNIILTIWLSGSSVGSDWMTAIAP